MMAKTNQELHEEAMKRFIKMANEMTNEGMSTRIVAAGLMTANCVYATYGAVGNKGLLEDEGIDRITEAFRQQLKDLRRVRRSKISARTEQKIQDTVEQIVSFPDDD